MRNTAVQERLFSESRDKPEEALKFAISFEKGVQQKKSITATTKGINMKQEPVAAVEKSNECYKCGKAPFPTAHQKICKARGVDCRKYGKTEHYARMCKSKAAVEQKPQTVMKKVNAVRQRSSWRTSNESREEVEVLHVEDEIVRGGKKLFVLKGTFNRK